MSEVIDKHRLLARLRGDVPLLREIVELFAESSRNRMEEIHAALAGGDLQVLAQAAHAFKGSVANFSARDAVEAAVNLEQLARAGALESARVASKVLEQEIHRLETALVDLLAEVSPPPEK